MLNSADWPNEDAFTRQLADPAFAAAVVEALKAGTLPGDLEALVWRLHYGEPSENSDEDERGGAIDEGRDRE